MLLGTKRRLILNRVRPDEGLERLDHDEELYIELLDELLRDAAFERLQAALDAGSAEDAFEAAHRLKGEMLNLGLEDSFAPLLEIVELTRAGNTGDARARYGAVAEMRCALAEIVERELDL